MPAISTLQDNFNDNIFNASSWARTNDTQILEQNSRMELSSILAGNYVVLGSYGGYDLTGAFTAVGRYLPLIALALSRFDDGVSAGSGGPPQIIGR